MTGFLSKMIIGIFQRICSLVLFLLTGYKILDINWMKQLLQDTVDREIIAKAAGERLLAYCVLSKIKGANNNRMMS